MTQLLRLILPIYLSLLGVTANSQTNNINVAKTTEDCFLDRLDYYSIYKLRITAYECFTSVGIYLEVVKDDLGYVLNVTYTSTPSLKSTSHTPEFIRLSTEQFEKIRQFENNLGIGHEHSQGYCSGTSFISVVYNKESKVFKYCGCGTSAYLEMKNILSSR